MTPPASSPPDKYGFLAKALFDEYVLVHVNPHHEGVKLPNELKQEGTVTLKISKFFKFPVQLSKQEITAQLRFGETYHDCIVPLAAVWGASSVKGESVMWAEDLPPALQSILSKAQLGLSKLKEVPSGSEGNLELEKSNRKRGHLKLVK